MEKGGKKKDPKGSFAHGTPKDEVKEEQEEKLRSKEPLGSREEKI
jgi:hypothetical protein